MSATNLVESDHPLSKFRFADAASRGRAVLAQRPARPSAYLIVGPPMSGKTTLVRLILARMCNVRESEIRARAMPATARSVDVMLWSALSEGYLFIDNLRLGKRRECVDQLAAFLTLKDWSFRPLRQTAAETVPNKCVVFLTSCDESDVPEEILRRVRVIRLTPEVAA